MLLQQIHTGMAAILNSAVALMKQTDFFDM